MIDNKNVATILLDNNLNIVSINKEAQNLLGCQLDILLHNSLSTIFEINGASIKLEMLLTEQLSTNNIVSFRGSKNLFRVEHEKLQSRLGEMTHVKIYKKEPEILKKNQIFSFQSHQLIKDNLKCHNDDIFFINQIVQSLPGRCSFRRASDLSYQCINSEALKHIRFNSAHQLINKDDYYLAKRVVKSWPLSFAQYKQDQDYEILATQKPIYGIEGKPYLNPDGQVVMYCLTKIPLYNKDNRPLGVITMAIDSEHSKNIYKLRKSYSNLYSNKKEGNQKFQEHIGLDKYTQNQSIHLTPREMDVFISLESNKRTKELAQRLNMKEKTAYIHIESIKSKLNANRNEVIDILSHIKKAIGN
ncbi:hypothetical protein CF386_09020 [Paraphotobacterium marinum]|uniref:HTH luxR-type domain-containing protein n=1 Tax=Paraphotobacterium marinum TaxID=1755811 RepID=A0A220VGA3_9GAMM|nr:LuxR C-terminal-related transcriptional regulator [Paraphotobacterium marinum]ASK79202.1 hypothetical protein CF386_09020 [Paraphotobacterium marinum]